MYMYEWCRVSVKARQLYKDYTSSTIPSLVPRLPVRVNFRANFDPGGTE